ncbi:MAG: tetratricopeptide repeat protein [Spirochaetota bacterium]
MRSLKNLSLLCLVAAIALVLGACAGGPKTVQPVPPTITTTSTTTTTTTTTTTLPAPPAPSPEEIRLEGVKAASELLAKGDADKAVEKFTDLVASNPNSPDMRMLKAAALASAGRLPESRTELDGILKDNPRFLAAFIMAIDIARFQSDDRGRLAYLNAAVAVAADDAAVLSALGQYYLDQKSWAKAEETYRKASLADPKNPDAFHGLGQALHRLSRYADAEAALDISLALESGNAFVWSDRSKARYQQGKYAEAEADLGLAIERAPDSAWIYLDRARLRLDSNRFEEAEKDLDASIQRDPNYFLAYVYRAAIYDKAGLDLEALADYDKIVALEPDYWYALESAGASAFRLGRFAEAADRFQRAFARAPTRYEYVILASISLLRQGRIAEGRALAGKIAPVIDRDKNHLLWLVLRLLQDQNDLTSELESKIQTEKTLDLKASVIFYLAEYWIVRGKSELGLRYLVYSQDMRREGDFKYRLLAPELKKLSQAGGRG